jgi:hypothetical protein
MKRGIVSESSHRSWLQFWDKFYYQHPLNHELGSAVKTVKWFLLGDPPGWTMAANRR